MAWMVTQDGQSVCHNGHEKQNKLITMLITVTKEKSTGCDKTMSIVIILAIKRIMACGQRFHR